MCIYYTQLKSKNKKNIKNSSGEVRDSTERPKLSVSGVIKGYRKNYQRFRHVMLHTGRI